MSRHSNQAYTDESGESASRYLTDTKSSHLVKSRQLPYGYDRKQEFLPNVLDANYYLEQLEEYPKNRPANKFVSKEAHDRLYHYRTKSFGYNEKKDPGHSPPR